MKETLNLMPGEQGERAVRRRGPGFFLIAGCIGYCAVLAGLWFLNNKELMRVGKEISVLSQKKAEVLAAVNASASASAPRVSPEAEIYHEMQAAHQWSAVLGELSRIVPERVWLASVETRQESGAIGFKGYALSQIDVASFISELERSDHFEAVEIVSSQKGATETFFELKARVTWTGKK